jgi:hypothetical protein
MTDREAAEACEVFLEGVRGLMAGASGIENWRLLALLQAWVWFQGGQMAPEDWGAVLGLAYRTHQGMVPAGEGLH